MITFLRSFGLSFSSNGLLYHSILPAIYLWLTSSPMTTHLAFQSTWCILLVELFLYLSGWLSHDELLRLIHLFDFFNCPLTYIWCTITYFCFERRTQWLSFLWLGWGVVSSSTRSISVSLFTYLDDRWGPESLHWYPTIYLKSSQWRNGLSVPPVLGTCYSTQVPTTVRRRAKGHDWGVL